VLVAFAVLALVSLANRFFWEERIRNALFCVESGT